MGAPLKEPWPDTEHWRRDHSSHGLTEAQLRHLLAINRPLRPQVCQNCQWPSSIGTLCKLCCDMAEAIMLQSNLMAEHEIWRAQRTMRRMGLL
jgi:hypothetical protein